MKNGNHSGQPSQSFLKGLSPISLFIKEEDGYTSLTVVVAILMVLSLLFSIASVSWLHSRSAEIQDVADAVALSGSNIVGAYSSLAQVLDACSLSMGLAGVLALGLGMLAALIPMTSGFSQELVKAGTNILQARQDFNHSAAEGLKQIEGLLPACIVANSFSVAANNSSAVEYKGFATPYPLESQSEFFLADDVVAKDIENSAHSISELSQKLEEEQEHKKKLLEEAWFYDCGAQPYSLYERASKLAGLSHEENPYCSSPEAWSFGLALSRARNYYQARQNQEQPLNNSVKEQINSVARRAFYSFASNELGRGYYRERLDEQIDLFLPSLPQNADEMRGTTLYTDRIWPCTVEPQGRMLHAFVPCVSAQGPLQGRASLQDLEAAQVVVDPQCEMSLSVMARVSAASTAIDNGFEYWWKKIALASVEYREAQEKTSKYEQEIKEFAQQGNEAFKKALNILKAARPKLCPPGAWGCVSIVFRTSVNRQAPPFSSAINLPEGVAISASSLAPVESSSTVISEFGERIVKGENFISNIWSDLLKSYGDIYTAVEKTFDNLCGKIDGLFATNLGSWLSDLLRRSLEEAGFQPVDVRPRRPVLVASQTVLDKAGLNTISEARKFMQRLSAETDLKTCLQILGLNLAERFLQEPITLAELEIPGTGMKIPLKIKLSDFMEQP